MAWPPLVQTLTLKVWTVAWGVPKSEWLSTKVRTPNYNRFSEAGLQGSLLVDTCSQNSQMHLKIIIASLFSYALYGLADFPLKVWVRVFLNLCDGFWSLWIPVRAWVWFRVTLRINTKLQPLENPQGGLGACPDYWHFSLALILCSSGVDKS